MENYSPPAFPTSGFCGCAGQHIPNREIEGLYGGELAQLKALTSSIRRYQEWRLFYKNRFGCLCYASSRCQAASPEFTARSTTDAKYLNAARLCFLGSFYAGSASFFRCMLTRPFAKLRACAWLARKSIATGGLRAAFQREHSPAHFTMCRLVAQELAKIPEWSSMAVD